jgi:hypothetical protein
VTGVDVVFTHSSTGSSVHKPALKKPDKPYEGCLLFAHAVSYWAKRTRGHMFYFGSQDDPNGTLQNYLDQRDALHAGREPRAKQPNKITVTRSV